MVLCLRLSDGVCRVATYLENLEKSWNLRVVREKSGKIGKVGENKLYFRHDGWFN